LPDQWFRDGLAEAGTPDAPRFRRAETLKPFDGYNVAPALADLDGDGDLDMLLGTWNQDVRYLRNEGTPQAPRWVEDEEMTVTPPRLSHGMPALGQLGSRVRRRHGRRRPGPLRRDDERRAAVLLRASAIGLSDPDAAHSAPLRCQGIAPAWTNKQRIIVPTGPSGSGHGARGGPQPPVANTYTQQ